MNDKDPNDIVLTDPAKLFEYEIISREVNQCEDISTLRRALLHSIRLYMNLQENLNTILE